MNTTITEAQTDALAARAAGGDREALAELYRVHQKTVLKLVASELRGADRADIEDAAQDVWLEVCLQISTFTPGTSFALWLSDLVLLVTVQSQPQPQPETPVAAAEPVRNPFANPLRIAALYLREAVTA
jgi:hypothetical protein